jgi:hypothetical protein|nr:MAG TPA: TraT complement resistance protein [Caudoviricetes sp.]
MDKVVIIKNQDDARNWLLNKISPTERDNRIGQAVAMGLLGAGLGAGANYGINRSARKGMLIGGALGALGGYMIKPKVSAEDNRNMGAGVLSGMSQYYVIASLPSGEVYNKAFKSIQEAKQDAADFKSKGIKAFVVAPDEFNSSRQFGLIDLGNKKNFEVFGKAAKAHVEEYKSKNGSIPKTSADLAKLERSARVAGMKAVKHHYGQLGAGAGSIGGAAVGTGVGYLAGKGIAKLKSKDAYIKEYLSKHPDANERDALEAYQNRVKSYQKIGGFLGAAAGIYGGHKLGRNYGLKQGAKIAARTSNRTILK